MPESAAFLGVGRERRSSGSPATVNDVTRDPGGIQTHGLRSRVYVPILREIVRRKHKPGELTIDFTKKEVEAVGAELGIPPGNAADVIYRMRARTKLPKDIREDLGFTILRAVGRGKYRLEKGPDPVVQLPEHEILDHNDQTPLPVRRLLPEDLADIDEQGLLTMVSYCKLLDHFTGLTVYRLRSHVRKSVPDVGQAELDQIDVGVALRDDDQPVVFPIEAKAADEVINRIQVATMVAYCARYFPGHEIRPVVIKLTYDGIIHFLEFNAAQLIAELEIVQSSGYRLRLSKQQRKLIRETQAMLAKAMPK